MGVSHPSSPRQNGALPGDKYLYSLDFFEYVFVVVRIFIDKSLSLFSGNILFDLFAIRLGDVNLMSSTSWSSIWIDCL